MANIHSFGEFEVAQNHAGNSVAPDSLWDSLKYVFCPRFSFYTISFALLAINVALFVILNIISWATDIGYSCVLYGSGALYAPDVKNYELYRLLLPVFLHFDLMHLLNNTISAIFMSFEPEESFGKLKFLVLYFGSSLYGCMLSCVCIPYSLSAGASGAIMGLIGHYIISFLFKSRSTDMKFYVVFLALLVMNLFMTFASPGGNAYAHLGGLVFGALYSLTQLNVQDGQNMELWKKLAAYVIILGPIVTIIWFVFLNVEYEPIC